MKERCDNNKQIIWGEVGQRKEQKIVIQKRLRQVGQVGLDLVLIISEGA